MSHKSVYDAVEILQWYFGQSFDREKMSELVNRIAAQLDSAFVEGQESVALVERLNRCVGAK